MSTPWRFLSVCLAGTLLLSGGHQGLAAPNSGPAKETKQLKKITQADRQAAADRAAARGFALPEMGTGEMARPGDPPHYFSHPNYANSPLPVMPPTVVTISDSDGGTGTGATATAIVTEGVVTGFDITTAGSGYTAPVVSIDGSATAIATATATVGPDGDITAITVNGGGSGYDGVQAGTGLQKFVDTLPDIPVAVANQTIFEGSDYYEIGVVQYRVQMHANLPATLVRGYVQLGGSVPLSNELMDGTSVPTGYSGVTAPSYLGPAIAATKNKPVRILFRNLLPTGSGGNLFLPVDTTVMGAGMGPAARMMEMDPQDPMCGSTMDPLLIQECFTENRAELHLHGGISPWISDGTPHQWITPAGERPYPDLSRSENKGVSVHNVPDMWFNKSGIIDDCAGQTTCSVEGATNNPGPGAQTYYYTNQQSARLMFYHDHSWGITRLNVYAGEAAPYLITDDTEKKLLPATPENPGGLGLIPGPADTIALVIQDKTFVPSMEQRAVSDETWDMARWGGEGNLWLPHVYSPAQNPGDASGVNQFGRWAYGPWFWPPTSNIKYGPIDNAYFDPACNPDLDWCEPPLMPGTPYNSMGMEAFMDTPVINGKAYPTKNIDPKPYRFRILNAANDRFFNLSIYKAVDANGNPCAPNQPIAPESTGIACTEVKLNPAEVSAALEDTTIFPTPDLNQEGPNWVQIGTEGGFLPKPVVIPPHVTTWVNDPTVFNAGNVDQHSLLLAPAERADVIVDFSAFAGQTLILYNDAPAAFPARDPRYDYYTGNADLRDTGGTPSTLRGYGPNTRTMMQIVVAPSTSEPAPAFNQDALETAFAHNSDGTGVFESGQHPITVGQSAYNSAYGTGFTTKDGLVQIYDTSITFKPLLKSLLGNFYEEGNLLTVPLRPKMIQDEMGEAFEQEYGRMSGFLGVETPNAQAGLQNMILYPYSSPPTEVLKGIQAPLVLTNGELGLDVTPIASTDDGTQIWKITHNGVDTHPIHVHLYDVQLLNRVGWDGIIRKPEANELGWKDTVRVSPLEDTIVAIRPIIPHVPFDLPNSVRLIDPSMAEGAYLADTTAQIAAGLPLFAFNPDGEPIDIINHYVNFGHEYVWHCHILSHEEMDMMHSQVIGVAPKAPTLQSAVRTGSGKNTRYVITYADNSTNETAFVLQRRVFESTDPWSTIATVDSAIFGVVPFIMSDVGPGTGVRAYEDIIGSDKNLYEYQVYAVNRVGDVGNYANPYNRIIKGGFPTLTLDSMGNAYAMVVATPSDLIWSAIIKNRKTATVTLNWADNANNETGFIIQRADDAWFNLGVVNATVMADMETFSQDVSRGRIYYYRISAFDSAESSTWSNTATVTTP